MVTETPDDLERLHRLLLRNEVTGSIYQLAGTLFEYLGSLLQVYDGPVFTQFLFKYQGGAANLRQQRPGIIYSVHHP
jgi:hypothetical protein